MKFSRSIKWSLFGHVAIMALAIFGLPNIREHKVEPIESIAIDVIDFSDAAQRAGEKAAPKSTEAKQKQTEQPKAELPSPKPEPKPKEVTAPIPQPPKVQPKEEKPEEDEKPVPPKPEVKPQPKPEPKPEPKPKEVMDPDGLMKKIAEAQKKPDVKPEPKVEPKSVQKPAEPKPATKPQKTDGPSKPSQNTATSNSSFDPTKISQLLNKEKPAAGASGVTGKPQEATQGAPKGLGSRLTQSQYAALQGMIRDQVSKCWSPPTTGGGDLKVKLDISMNPDGTLSSVPQVLNSSNDPNFRAVADAAVRAVRRCASASNPLKLPADQYNVENGWKEIEFLFDPSQF